MLDISKAVLVGVLTAAVVSGWSGAAQAAPQQQAPEFTGVTRWFNSPPLRMAGLRGKVVLVEFWTKGCINCLHTLAHVQNWHSHYKDKGLVVVGVHSPEMESERPAEAVSKAITQHGLSYPVAQDNDYKTWDAWRNAYWPALYLVDRQGRVVFTHIGEGDYEVIEQAIQSALR